MAGVPTPEIEDLGADGFCDASLGYFLAAECVADYLPGGRTDIDRIKGDIQKYQPDGIRQIVRFCTGVAVECPWHDDERMATLGGMLGNQVALNG